MAKKTELPAPIATAGGGKQKDPADSVFGLIFQEINNVLHRSSAMNSLIRIYGADNVIKMIQDPAIVEKVKKALE